jgi:hypothetical protein
MFPVYEYAFTSSRFDDNVWVYRRADRECVGYFKPDYTFVPIVSVDETTKMLRDCLAKMRRTQ